MNSLVANVLNETEKLWKRKRTKGFLLFTILIPVLSAVLFAFIQNNAGVILALGRNLPLMMLSLFTLAILPLYLFLTASESFSGEVANRTLKLGLVRPITRTKVFASKVAAITIFIAVFLMVLMISSIILGWFVQGGDISIGLLDIVKAYTSSFIPMLAIGLISVFIAQFFNNSNAAMAMIIFIYAGAKLLPFVFPQISVLSIFSYTNWYILWIGNGASIATISNTFALLFSYCIIAYTLGVILFERKQL